jgi:hypothetical protein
MSKEHNPGDLVRSKKPGKGNGTVLSKDVDASATQVMGPDTTYTVQWEDGTRESMVYPDELEGI